MAVGEAPLPEFFAIPGIKVGFAEAGIKKSARKDLVLFELQAGASCAGVFTQNAFCAAPVTVSKEHLKHTSDQSKKYLLINTGNANAGTGSQGLKDARESCKALAEIVSVEEQAVLPFSTGVIGEYLPMDTILNAFPALVGNLNERHWAHAAEGIMTTDTRPKGAVRSIVYNGEEIVLNGISKGAGMIKPNMATMLAFVGTNIRIPQALCETLLQEATEMSFNRITVDGDTSTNDACMLFASAASEQTLDPAHSDFSAFKGALISLFIELAQAIVKDAEGASKFVAITIEQAKDTQEALGVAYTIAHSPLVKTALFASDPNWGRILAALGRAPITELVLEDVDIYLGDVRIVHHGGKCASYSEEAGQKVMDREAIEIRVTLSRGSAKETVWTSDLSHEYVTINAEYRT